MLEWGSFFCLCRSLTPPPPEKVSKTEVQQLCEEVRSKILCSVILQLSKTKEKNGCKFLKVTIFFPAWGMLVESPVLNTSAEYYL